MAVQAPSLDVFVDRNLPIEGANLVFASTDDRGTPGALNSWVFEQLGLSPKLLAAAAEKLEKGYAISTDTPGTHPRPDRHRWPARKPATA